LDRAVDSAFNEIQLFFVSIPPLYSFAPDGIRAAYGIADEKARQRAAAEAVLSDDEFMRVFLPQLHASLREYGLVCSGCPSIVGSLPRSLPWAEFSRYVTRFISARLRTGTNGKLVPAFGICSGTEVAVRIPDADPDLLRAGFFLAVKTDAVREITMDEIDQSMSDLYFLELSTDAQRNAYVQQRISNRLASDPAVLHGVCKVLAQYVGRLGVDVLECNVSDGATALE
jgi:hypothetical protein